MRTPTAPRTLTQTEIYADHISLETARSLVAVVSREMRLTHAERAAIGHAVARFIARRARGLLKHGHITTSVCSPVLGETEGDGETAKNVTFETLQWLGALRGTKGRKGDKVLGMHNGRCFFGVLSSTNTVDWNGHPCFEVRADLLDGGVMPFTFYRSGSQRRFRNIKISTSSLVILRGV